MNAWSWPAITFVAGIFAIFIASEWHEIVQRRRQRRWLEARRHEWNAPLRRAKERELFSDPRRWIKEAEKEEERRRDRRQR